MLRRTRTAAFQRHENPVAVFAGDVPWTAAEGFRFHGGRGCPRCRCGIRFPRRGDRAPRSLHRVPRRGRRAVRPEAVRGQEWLATHESAGGRLEWSPAAAAASCTATLAVTTGPWRYSNARVASPLPVTTSASGGSTRRRGGVWCLITESITPVPCPPINYRRAFARLWPGAGEGKCTGRGDLDGLAEAEERFNEQVERGDCWRRCSGRLARVPWPTGTMRLPARFRVAARARCGVRSGAVARTVGTVFEPGTDLAVTHGILQSPDGCSVPRSCACGAAKAAAGGLRSTCVRRCRRSDEADGARCNRRLERAALAQRGQFRRPSTPLNATPARCARRAAAA